MGDPGGNAGTRTTISKPPVAVRLKGWLRDAFDLRLGPEQDVTLKFGMDTLADHARYTRDLDDKMATLRRKRDNATTLLVVTSLAGVVWLSSCAAVAASKDSGAALVSLASGFAVLLLAVAAQLALAIRATVEGRLDGLRRRQEKLDERGRVAFVGGWSRRFPTGGFHAGHVTNVGSQPCIVLLPTRVQVVAQGAKPFMAETTSWAMVVSAEEDLVPGATNLGTALEWNQLTKGPQRVIRLAPGESAFVAFGLCWGNRGPEDVHLVTGLSVVDGFGAPIDVHLPPQLERSPDNDRLIGRYKIKSQSQGRVQPGTTRSLARNPPTAAS